MNRPVCTSFHTFIVNSTQTCTHIEIIFFKKGDPYISVFYNMLFHSTVFSECLSLPLHLSFCGLRGLWVIWPFPYCSASGCLVLSTQRFLASSLCYKLREVPPLPQVTQHGSYLEWWFSNSPSPQNIQGTLLKPQMAGPHPTCSESGSLGVGLASLPFNKLPGDSGEGVGWEPSGLEHVSAFPEGLIPPALSQPLWESPAEWPRGRSVQLGRQCLQANSQSISGLLLQLLRLLPCWRLANSQALAFTCFPSSSHPNTFTEIPLENILDAFF